MNKTNVTTHNVHAQREHFLSSEHSLISLKPILAGLFVAFISWTTLTALGVGIGLASASDMIREGQDSNGLGMSAIIWMIAVTIISLGAGSYFAARTSTFVTRRIGAAHGLIIASLYFSVMMFGTGQTLGAIGKSFGYIVGAAGAGAGGLSTMPMVQNAVEDGLGGEKLKSEPKVVVEGILTRLVQGNPEAAKNYIAYQSGLSGAELDRRFNKIQGDFRAAEINVGAKTTAAISQVAWVILFLLAVGIATAVFTGAWGAGMNFKMPLADDEGSISHFKTRSAL